MPVGSSELTQKNIFQHYLRGEATSKAGAVDFYVCDIKLHEAVLKKGYKDFFLCFHGGRGD